MGHPLTVEEMRDRDQRQDQDADLLRDLLVAWAPAALFVAGCTGTVRPA